MNNSNNSPMDMAIKAATEASVAGEVPVGAVITLSGEIIAIAANAMRKNGDATAHAEILAIRLAMERLGSERLENCDLYVTLEPCTMCAGAISHARIRRLYFAAPDIKAGAVENGVRFFEQASCHHRPEVVAGIGEDKSRTLLSEFFASRR